MKITLRSIDPFSPPLSFKIDCLPAVIGRNGRSDVKINDRWISDRHCELVEHDQEVYIRDTRSKHGVLVNGKPVSRAIVQPGDALTVGIRTLQIEYSRTADDAIHTQSNGSTQRAVEASV